MTALIEALKDVRNYIRAIEIYDSLIALNPDPDYIFDKAFILLTAIEDYSLGIPALELALQEGFSDTERLSSLSDYPDLLDKDRILSVIISYPIEESENEE